MTVPRFLSRLYLALSAALLVVASSTAGAAKPTPPPDHWVGTWSTANVDRANVAPANRPAAADAPAFVPFGAADTTLREIVHVSLGGSLIRVELSNQFGTEPLTIGAAHIALAGSAPGDLALGSANALTFGGRTSVTIPPGAEVVSDPAGIALPFGGDLTLSLFIPAQQISHLTVHNSAYQTNFMAGGNFVGQRSLPTPVRMTSWFFLKAVDVQTAGTNFAVVTLGDSITDGTFTTTDQNRRWPDVLARRLHDNKATAGLSVLNAGIGGNRILHTGSGLSALSRFDTDVLAQSGVRYVIVLEGINDIGAGFNTKDPHDLVTAEDLIAGLTQLAERAHMHGLKIFAATLTPYAGAGYMSPAGEQVRQALNAFIRSDKTIFDGIIDFEAATRDAASPPAFNPAFDRGDHLHPNDAGMKAMGDAINLKLFEPNKQEKYDITRQP